MTDKHIQNNHPHTGNRTLLWWGRSGLDYSRNRIMRQHLQQLGWVIEDFWPRISRFGHLEALLRVRSRPALVWVPCFRQRDLAQASHWAHARGIPVIFDALISAYDKQVHEKERFPADSWRAKRLLKWERKVLSMADHLLVDTPSHQAYFHQQLGVPMHSSSVVSVGAEDRLFHPARPDRDQQPLQVLFYGSFIPLQGPQHIIEAARLAGRRDVQWHLIGNGPLLDLCKKAAEGLQNVHFEPWLPYESLGERIARADILLGVFGGTRKTQRVIPNKVFQSLACGKPVITTRTDAYPEPLLNDNDAGLRWVDAADPRQLADTIDAMAAAPDQLEHMGRRARASYETFFSESKVRAQLSAAIEKIGRAR